MGMKLGFPHERINVGSGCSRMGYWGSCLGLGGSGYQEVGENCIVRSFMICTPYQILFRWKKPRSTRWVASVAHMRENGYIEIVVG